MRSVVFPAPFGPRMATTVPASALRSNWRTMAIGAVAGL